MIIVTGGCGFIGSNLVLYLNQQGINDIMVVDDLTDGKKFRNLNQANISDYCDQEVFRNDILRNKNYGTVEAVFHQGACSDTTCWDGKYMMDNNYQFSKELLIWCEQHQIPFIYASSASVYGDGKRGFKEHTACECPLNVYAWSKWLFDQWVRKNTWKTQVVGLRYFNVYGPNEEHKDHMASVIFHLIKRVNSGENLVLFGAYDGYESGMQKRDFVYITDVLKMNHWFLLNPSISGIFNCGTGQAESFLSVTTAIQSHFPAAKIDFIPFPEHLKKSYQSYTQADLSELKKHQYPWAFVPLNEGVSNYVQHHASL